MNRKPILQVENLKKHYPIQKLFSTVGTVKAVDGVNLELFEQETLAIVGESGCGKSTLGKVIIQLESITGGKVQLFDKDVKAWDKEEFCKTLQMIFQDPYGSLNPRKKVWRIIAEPLFINTNQSTEECRQAALAVMKQVGLKPEHAERYPHMFSGGQRQRIGIARALILRPKILVCDEPVSALDVSVQAQVLNLLMDLQDQLKLSYIFISHDLWVVKHICDRVMVMYLGRAAEYGPRKEIFENPRHPYTQALLRSTPNPKSATSERQPLKGEIPSPLNPPSGCPFHTRCPWVIERCRKEVPAWRPVAGRQVACHRADEGVF